MAHKYDVFVIDNGQQCLYFLICGHIYIECLMEYSIFLETPTIAPIHNKGKFKGAVET